MPTINEAVQRAAQYQGGDAPVAGFEQVTGLSAAKGLTVPAGAKVAYINTEDQSVRWRDDGTNPTTTVGGVLEPGSYFSYTGDLSAIKFIEETASAKLNVSYYS